MLPLINYKELNQWGMEIIPEMLSIQGHVFNSEKIWYTNNRPFTVDGKIGNYCLNSETWKVLNFFKGNGVLYAEQVH